MHAGGPVFNPLILELTVWWELQTAGI